MDIYSILSFIYTLVSGRANFSMRSSASYFIRFAYFIFRLLFYFLVFKVLRSHRLNTVQRPSWILATQRNFLPCSLFLSQTLKPSFWVQYIHHTASRNTAQPSLALCRVAFTHCFIDSRVRTAVCDTRVSLHCKLYLIAARWSDGPMGSDLRPSSISWTFSTIHERRKIAHMLSRSWIDPNFSQLSVKRSTGGQHGLGKNHISRQPVDVKSLAVKFKPANSSSLTAMRY